MPHRFKTFDWVNFRLTHKRRHVSRTNPSVTSHEEFPYGDWLWELVPCSVLTRGLITQKHSRNLKQQVFVLHSAPFPQKNKNYSINNVALKKIQCNKTADCSTKLFSVCLFIQISGKQSILEINVFFFCCEILSDIVRVRNTTSCFFNTKLAISKKRS